VHRSNCRRAACAPAVGLPGSSRFRRCGWEQAWCSAPPRLADRRRREVQDLESLWRDDDTSRLTAQALDRLWKREEQEIRRDREALAQYVSLLDKLKRAGEPLAARLLAGVQL
jgi:hypothetical protein